MSPKLQRKKVKIVKIKGWAIIIKDKFRMYNKLAFPDIFTTRRLATRRMEMSEYYRAQKCYKVIPVEISYQLTMKK